jgi:hypothetical protein
MVGICTASRRVEEDNVRARSNKRLNGWVVTAEPGDIGRDPPRVIARGASEARRPTESARAHSHENAA